MLGSVRCVCTHKLAAHQNCRTQARFCWAEGCQCRNFQALPNGTQGQQAGITVAGLLAQCDGPLGEVHWPEGWKL